jgi:hypothetical protein
MRDVEILKMVLIFFGERERKAGSPALSRV